MFAAVNGNVIYIYSVTSFENILNLKGHNGKVSQAGECIIQRESPPHCMCPFGRAVSTVNWAAVTMPRQQSYSGNVFRRCAASNGVWTTAGWCHVGWMARFTSGTHRPASGNLRVSSSPAATQVLPSLQTARPSWLWEQTSH